MVGQLNSTDQKSSIQQLLQCRKRQQSQLLCLHVQRKKQRDLFNCNFFLAPLAQSGRRKTSIPLRTHAAAAAATGQTPQQESAQSPMPPTPSTPMLPRRPRRPGLLCATVPYRRAPPHPLPDAGMTFNSCSSSPSPTLSLSLNFVFQLLDWPVSSNILSNSPPSPGPVRGPSRPGLGRLSTAEPTNNHSNVTNGSNPRCGVSIRSGKICSIFQVCSLHSRILSLVRFRFNLT